MGPRSVDSTARVRTGRVCQCAMGDGRTDSVQSVERLDVPRALGIHSNPHRNVVRAQKLVHATCTRRPCSEQCPRPLGDCENQSIKTPRVTAIDLRRCRSQSWVRQQLFIAPTTSRRHGCSQVPSVTGRNCNWRRLTGPVTVGHLTPFACTWQHE
jgi:hypothetical protein